MNREDEVAENWTLRRADGRVFVYQDINWLVRVARAARETIEVFIDASTPQQRVDAMEELRTLLLRDTTEGREQPQQSEHSTPFP